MSLPIVKLTKYDLPMWNVSPAPEKECLVMLEGTGDMTYRELNKNIDMWTNAYIDKYTKLIKQMNYNENDVGYTVDINGRIESPYENTGYSDRTTTSSYKYGGGGSTDSYGGGRTSTIYPSNKMSYLYPHFEFIKSVYGIWKIRYEIQPGDTLSEIASAAGLPLEIVLKYNPQIRNPNKINAYDWINLPTDLLVEPEKFAYEFNQRKELLKNKTVAELKHTSRKEPIDTHSRMMPKVDSKHILCLACGCPIHEIKIGERGKKYCKECGVYLPEIVYDKEMV